MAREATAAAAAPDDNVHVNVISDGTMQTPT
jgi:hypothetical protein